MTQLATRPNVGTGIEAHTLALPPCCPVSHNPCAGSTITICYRPKEKVLDVIPLPAYIHRFVGGWHTEQGKIDIRDMEAMIQRIADDCAASLHVPVRVYADLILRPASQRLRQRVRAYPQCHF